MKLKMLEENYVTCKVVYIDFSKYESIRDINIVNPTVQGLCDCFTANNVLCACKVINSQ